MSDDNDIVNGPGAMRVMRIPLSYIMRGISPLIDDDEENIGESRIYTTNEELIKKSDHATDEYHGLANLKGYIDSG